MTVHFPPTPNEPLNCRHERWGRTGAHGFKEEDYRKEHCSKTYMKANEHPSRKNGECLSAASEKQNTPMRVTTNEGRSEAREERLPPSDDFEASEPEAVGEFGIYHQHKLYENLPDQETPGLKVSHWTTTASDDVIERTATASEDVATESSGTSQLSSSSNEEDTREEMKDRMVDELEEGMECENRNPNEMVLGRNEALTASMSRRPKNHKLAVIESQVLETLAASEAGQYCASLNIQWNLLTFMEDQCRDNDSPNKALGLVVTISGSAQQAQATTCFDYVNQNWPAYGSKVLDALQGALDSHTHTSRSEIATCVDGESVSSDDVTSSNTKLEFDVNKGTCILNIESPAPNIIKYVIQQLIWMGAALRTSRDGRVQYCESKLERNQKTKETDPAIFTATFDMSSPSEENQSCWFPLFTNPAIARGFPTAPRCKNEVGLEIPIDMMAALGGVRHAADFEGGLVLKGYSALFVPIMCHEGSVQWHLLRARGEERISYREASIQCPNRVLLKDLNHGALRTTRAYLGWWPEAETHLGTAEADYGSIDWSSACEAKRLTRISGANVGFSKIITGGVNFQLGAKDGKLHTSQNGPLQRIVQRAEKIPVVLHDLEDSRAWFVPALDVMLHIVQTRHHQSPFRSDGKVIELSPSDPGKHGRTAAEAIVANQSRLLYERAVSEDGYYFKDAILDVWSQMERLMEKDDLIESCPGLALHGTLRTKVYGWEFMSLVQDKNHRRKEVTIAKSSGGWVDLVNDIDALVLFATGFGEIIRPVSDLGRLCHQWRSLPKGKDYLAAGVPLLELLYSEAGSRLSRKNLSTTRLQWHRASTLFEQCPYTRPEHCECDRTQQIYHESLFKTFGRVRPPGTLEENGCVIFGQAYHPLKPITIRNKTIYKSAKTSMGVAPTAKIFQSTDNVRVSQSLPIPASPETPPVDSHGTRSPKRPSSPLSLHDDTVQEEAAAPRRRKVLDVNTLSMDTCKATHRGKAEIAFSDDWALYPLQDQSMFTHDTQPNRTHPGYTQTRCASKAEHAAIYTRNTLRHKAKIEDYSHRHGCSCTICCTVDFEPPDTIDISNDTNGTRRNVTNTAERGQRQPV